MDRELFDHLMTEAHGDWRPKVGDVVCDCRYRHLKIKEVDADDPDAVTLEDGSSCSLIHCCDRPDHEQPHP